MTRRKWVDILISVTTYKYVINKMKINSLQIRELLLEKNLRLFGAKELGGLLGLSRRRRLYYLEKGLNEGLLVKLKRGLYCLKTDRPSELEIANRLYRPSYISFEYALAFYNLLPEMVYTVTSATGKTTRNFSVEGKNYQFTAIKPAAFTGYELKTVGATRCLMAEPGKALADYLYLVSLGRRAAPDRLNLAGLGQAKVGQYSRLFQRSSLNGLVAKIFKETDA